MNIYEVAPRDGIQNSPVPISTSEKVFMIESLHSAGIKNMEITSFVNPKLVPQMSDAAEVFQQTKHLGNFDVLIPNKRGFDNAKNIGAKNFNIFFSPSKEFNHRNLNRTLDEKFEELDSMLVETDRSNVRAYISCAFGCPFEGKPSEYALKNAMLKADYLADTIVLCDTIGVAHPTQMLQTLELTKGLDAEIALHLHENKKIRNDIFSNVKVAVEWGVETFDSSINGLGGCPFIPNSGGNLSTNRLINWANDNGYETGIELENLREITEWVNRKHS
jgi:hydroxymethylglutaryl-CoA lyase|tara:strand:- start:1694 stop:2521 length:828 start_codon:yes stop_codon:yes gene_type:complete